MKKGGLSRELLGKCGKDASVHPCVSAVSMIVLARAPHRGPAITAGFGQISYSFGC